MVPKMQEVAKRLAMTPTISFTGSAVHFFAATGQLSKPGQGEIFTTLSGEDAKQKYGTMDRYNISKLLVMLGVRELADRVSFINSADAHRPSIIVTNAAPGYCKTPMILADANGPQRVALKLIGRSSEQGSRTLVHGVVAGPTSHGKYLSECKVKPCSAWITSKEGAEVQSRVWAELVAKFEAIKPGITAPLQLRCKNLSSLQL